MDLRTQASAIDYPEKVVAFLDILGFRQLVLQSREQAKSVICRLNSALDHAIQCLSLEGGPNWFSIKLFSDCFCITCNDLADDLWLMFTELGFLQWYLATQGIFIGGGLSFGAHYENDKIIFSEGLVRAYDLQSHDPYPRILIDQKLVEHIELQPQNHCREELLRYMIRGQDGAVCLDYLERIADFDHYAGNLDETLEEHKKAILEQVSLNRSSPSVLDKYRWLASYHNFKFTTLYNSEEWDEAYFEKLRNRLVISPDAFPSFEKI